MGFSSVIGASSVIRPGVCTSTTRPSSPYDGQVVYETDTNTLAVYDGSAWVSLNPVDRDRNVIINGAMQIAQRGTSVTGITTTGYRTADRYALALSSLGTWTQDIQNDAPTGSGFRKSLRMLCTTADASPAASDECYITQIIEGQNVQHFLKGTSSARPFALSFWVKGTTTGTYIAELFDVDNSRSVSASYTISVANTWEKKTITFPADTTGVFDNDNNASLYLIFWLAAGSNLTSGTLNTTWGGAVTANRAVGQTNLAGATNRSWQVTGVQLEVGAVATPFEFEDIGTTLAKCQRYYYRNPAVYMNGTTTFNNSYTSRVLFPVTTRSTSPVITLYGGGNLTGTINRWNAYNSTGGQGEQAVSATEISNDGFQALFIGNSTYTLFTGSYTMSDEL